MITLSPKLSRLISEQAIDCMNGKLDLKVKDIDALKRVIIEKEKAKIPISRKRAINAFIQVAEKSERSKVLEKVLLDTTELDRTRLSAAHGLGQLTDDKSEKTLIQALKITEGFLQGEVIKSLGQMGSKKALKALDAFRSSGNQEINHRLAFSKMLIRYRTEDVEISASQIKKDLGMEWRKQTATQLNQTKLKKGIGFLRGNTFALNFSETLGYELHCDVMKNLLLLSDKIEAGNFLESLKARSQISAVVVLRNPKEVFSTLRYLVMTNVTEAGFDILVTRTTGELVYAGEAVLAGEIAHFTLRDVGCTKAPTNIMGRVSAQDIQFSVSCLRPRLKKVGQRV